MSHQAASMYREPERPPYERYPHLPHYRWGEAPSYLATSWQLYCEKLRSNGGPVAVLSNRASEVPLYDGRDTRRSW